MQKQKKGFWLFICSLIPGAGEMYMGFMKQGLSIMLLFWGIIAFAGALGMGWITIFLPIIWLYSFFNVHNLKSLSAEEFYSIEDSYILHMDSLIGNASEFLPKHRKLAGILLIILGAVILWNHLTDSLYWILPERYYDFIGKFLFKVPQIVLAIAIILAGWYILTGKKKKLDETAEASQEHYWEPYRPYQQPEAESGDSQEASPVMTQSEAESPEKPEANQ